MRKKGILLIISIAIIISSSWCSNYAEIVISPNNNNGNVTITFYTNNVNYDRLGIIALNVMMSPNNLEDNYTKFYGWVHKVDTLKSCNQLLLSEIIKANTKKTVLKLTLPNMMKEISKPNKDYRLYTEFFLTANYSNGVVQFLEKVSDTNYLTFIPIKEVKFFANQPIEVSEATGWTKEIKDNRILEWKTNNNEVCDLYVEFYIDSVVTKISGWILVLIIAAITSASYLWLMSFKVVPKFKAYTLSTSVLLILFILFYYYITRDFYILGFVGAFGFFISLHFLPKKIVEFINSVLNWGYPRESFSSAQSSIAETNVVNKKQ